jgi:hypothetical protein
MRYFFAIAVVLAALGYNPESRAFLQKLPDESMEYLRKVAFTKDISVAGTKFVSEEEVHSSLPLDESVFWWLVNSEKVVAALASNKYVASAKVTPCSDLLFNAWGCFRVNIIEHEPKYLVDQGMAAWIASSEGTFLKPVKDSENGLPVEELQAEYGPLTVVTGLAGEGSSPDLVNVRFEYVRNTLNVIENEIGHSISQAKFSPNGEITVVLRDSGINARFAYADEDWGALKNRSTRLRTLLQEVKGREDTIELIDLAYQKLAVVKKIVPPS